MIDANYFWNNILLLAAGTLIIRGTFIAMSSRIKISDRLREIFSFIPTAVLPAFIAHAVFFNQGQQTWLLGKERFFVVVISTAVCFYSKSTLLTILFGLGFLYLLNYSL